MTLIERATEQDFRLVSELARLTFIESHGHSASPDNINNYIAQKYTPEAMKEDLRDEKNIYHIIYSNGQPAGYSKIIFNTPFTGRSAENVTKLERLYLLKSFYDLKLGATLFEFNMELAKKNSQSGIWLFVWKENERANNFYKKYGFVITGSHDFKLSDTHSNPNHEMFLAF